jgi:thioredoxin-related protein
MKQILTIAICLLVATLGTKAEGIEFFEGSWQEAKDYALKQDKLIFVDAYTTWCGPCKRMAKSTFPDKQVGQYFNDNFVNVKLDMEKGEGPRFAQTYQVRSYPTLLFIDGAGELVHRAVGAKDPTDFLKLGKMVSRKNDKSEDLAKLYEEGKRDPEFIYKYVKALNKADKPSLKISNDYLKTQEDLSTDFNLRFIFEAVTEADSRIFDMMIKHKSEIIKLFSQDEFNQKVIAVTNKTINKAIEYESPALLAEAKEKINHISDKDRAELFHVRADKKYFLLVGDSKNYLKACGKYIKYTAGKDANLMYLLAREASENLPTDKKVLAKAEQWAGKAFKMDGKASHAYTYADLLYQNDKPEKALGVAKAGLEAAKEEKANPALLMKLIQKIELSIGS